MSLGWPGHVSWRVACWVCLLEYKEILFLICSLWLHHGGTTHLAPVQRGRLLPKPISYSPTHSISSLVNLFEQFTNLTGNVHCDSIANSLFPVHKSGGLPVRRFGKKVGSVLTGRSPRDCFPRFPPCFPYTMPSSHFLKTVFKFIIMPWLTMLTTWLQQTK